MSIPLRVLLVEDKEDDATLILRVLGRGGFDITRSVCVEDSAGMVAQLRAQEWDIILSDYSLPHFSAPEALTLLQDYMRETGVDLPFIVISGSIGEKIAVEMMKAGAADYLLKDKLDRLPPAVARELREAEGRRERRRAEAAQHESEARLSAIIESAMDAIVSADERQRVVSFNPAAERMFGWRADEIVGQPLDLLLPEEASSARADTPFRSFASPGFDGPAGTGALLARRRDGSTFPVEATVSTVQLGEQKLFTAFVRDITERQRAAEALRESEERQRAFFRDVLFSVTEGRLRLCDDRSVLPPPRRPVGDPIPLTHETLATLRQRIREAATVAELPAERWHNLLVAAGEAAMNAVVHAGGGVGNVRASAQTVQVWVRDAGKGITQDVLHRATLERGWTTAGTLGHGFWLMLRTCDRAYMLTGAEGTTVVLEQDLTPPEPPWL